MPSEPKNWDIKTSPNIHELQQIEKLSCHMVKPLNFVHTIIFLLTTTMMFLDKFKYFLYEFSFIQLRQGQMKDL